MKKLTDFYKLTKEQRKDQLISINSELEFVDLPETTGDAMVENFVRLYQLPMGIATNFQIDGQLFQIPMAIEEPSVIAAASNGAKRIGNIETSIDERELIGEIVFLEIENLEEAKAILDKANHELIELAKSHSESMVNRGGGPTRIWTEIQDQFLTLYLGFNPCEAMGANAINHVLEAISGKIEEMINGNALMRILSNYQPDSLVRAYANLQISSLAPNLEDARQLANRIAEASNYARLDVYRATTHNKGIMNGIDAVVMATGNDWRAVNAGVHAYASHSGKYLPLSHWWIDGEYLKGDIALPLPVATVGGTISVHPAAKWSLQLLGNPNVEQLARIIAAVGLAQNFAAIRAIVSEGIQKGHMGLHARQLALQAGAVENEIPLLVDAIKKQKSISISIAEQLLTEIRSRTKQ